MLVFLEGEADNLLILDKGYFSRFIIRSFLKEYMEEMMLSETDQIWAQETLNRVERKMEKVSLRSADKIPYTAIDGVHNDMSDNKHIANWTNGFWGGIMWQLYVLTGKEQYRYIAEKTEEKLDRNLMCYAALSHDSGFIWMPTAVADWRLTKNTLSQNRALLAAANLAGRYNCEGKFIRAWNSSPDQANDNTGWAIIDCMMNLSLLYWASEETGDPRFYHIAVNHANTTADFFIRADGSLKHIVEFDVNGGGFVDDYGGQGACAGSSWTRGQSWGLYGFVLSYLHTGNEKYLECARKIASYFMTNIPEGGLIPVDFCQPPDVTWEDGSAAAIAACGLIELAKLDKGIQQKLYLDAALKMLKALEQKGISWNESEDMLLTKCSTSYHEKNHEYPIIYGDYFFVEALMKLTGHEFSVW